MAVSSLLLGSPAAAGDLFLSISPGGSGGPPRPADPILRTIDSADGLTVASVTITLAGEIVFGGTALARDPQTGVLYAMLKVAGKQFPELVTLDGTTGVAVSVGVTQDRFSAMAFLADGTLFGVSGDGGVVSEALYTINKATGQATLQDNLGAGSDGEALAFNPDDGLLYHASGSGNQNQNNGERFETVHPTTFNTTTLTLSGDDYTELTSLTYFNGGFLGGDLGSALADMPDLYAITASGVVTFIGDMDHVSKGLAPITPPRPSHLPALSLPMMVLLAGGLLVAGALRVRARSA